MTRKTAVPAPDAEKPAAPMPLPSEGGSYTRNPDGSLTRGSDAPAAETPAEEA